MVESIPDLRCAIETHLRTGDLSQALQAMRALWRSQPTSATAGFLLGFRGQLQSLPGRRAWRIAILRSFTVEPMLPLLEVSSMLEGIDLTIYTGGFNTYAQELLDPASALYEFAPDAVIVAVQTRDIAPELWDQSAQLDSHELHAISDEVCSQIKSLLDAFRGRSRAMVIWHSFDQPVVPSRGILDSQSTGGQCEAIRALNRGLRKVAGEFQGVSVLDYEGLVRRYGAENWYDPIKWLTARLPISAGCLRHLAREWFRFQYALVGSVRKVLVTDLDNTLWGGLAGEGGLEGVVLSKEYPGAGYRNLQQALLDLSERGILLAIASKNNDTDVFPILEGHPEMLLRPAHFAAMRINWQDKARNLREIALELNLGLDSLVFLDDNPAERELIRRELPEVEVIELPPNPMSYAATLRESVMFERLTLTAEDRQRVHQYQQQRERRVAAQATGLIEEYYRSLGQKLTVAAITPETLARVAQLTQKTNQFNMTTRRYSEEEIRDIAAENGSHIYTVKVEDRFGDNGIVGVVIARDSGPICEIDTFLLSCRVIGRTVETGILSFLAEDAHSRGRKVLRGVYLPTKKNAPAAVVYPSHGFVEESSVGEEGQTWQLLTGPNVIPCPEWIEMQVVHGNSVSMYAA